MNQSMFSIFALVLSVFVVILPLFYTTCLVSKWICSRKFCHKLFISKLSYIIIKLSQTDPETDSIDSIPYRTECEHCDEQEVVHIDPIYPNRIDGDSSTYGTFG